MSSAYQTPMSALTVPLVLRRVASYLGPTCLVWMGASISSARAADDSTISDSAVTLVVVVLLLYFLPAIIASARKHNQRVAIFWLNLFLGWTFLGWIAAFVWAFTNPIVSPANVASANLDGTKRLGALKVCPRCAEEVKAQALICRFCNHEFAVAELPPSIPAPPETIPELTPTALPVVSPRRRIDKSLLLVGALLCIPVGLIIYGVNADKPSGETFVGSTQVPGNSLGGYTKELSSLIKTRMNQVNPMPRNGGVAIVSFKIDRSGQVSDTRVTTTSGKTDVDVAAMAALYPGTTLIPFPDNVTQNSLSITIPMRYSARP